MKDTLYMKIKELRLTWFRFTKPFYDLIVKLLKLLP